jgi:hypothetical protein
VLLPCCLWLDRALTAIIAALCSDNPLLLGFILAVILVEGNTAGTSGHNHFPSDPIDVVRGTFRRQSKMVLTDIMWCSFSSALSHENASPQVARSAIMNFR